MACLLKFLAATVGASLLFMNDAEAKDSPNKYLLSREPRKLALIIGNSDYKDIVSSANARIALGLPGARKDAEAVYSVLKEIGFSDKPHLNVRTTAEFQHFVLKPFLNKLQEGDFVVVYFSGHGFTYDGDSYLVPTQFPISPTSKDEFISVAAIRDTIAAYKPGQMVTILDACRSNADFSTLLKSVDSRLVRKGFPEVPNATNEIIAYASAPGTPAFASDEEKLSVYTEKLVKQMSKPDQEWDDLAREVRFAVKTATNSSQVPWVSGSRSSYVYFKPSKQTYTRFRETWNSTLQNGGTYETVSKYAEFYPTSPYTSAARRWLRDHPDKDVNKFTQISPSLVEKSWTSAAVGKSTSIVPRVTADIAFPRSQTTVPNRSISEASEAGFADILVDAGEIITLARLNGRERPSLSSKIVTTFEFGNRLKVIDQVPDTDGHGQWFKVADPSAGVLYVRFVKKVLKRPIDLGFPIKEMLVRKRASGFPTLLDDKQISQVTRDLRTKYRLTWASVATPRLVKPEDKAIAVARANNAVSILNHLGLSRKKITVLEGGDFVGDFIRIRFFGKL